MEQRGLVSLRYTAFADRLNSPPSRHVEQPKMSLPNRLCPLPGHGAQHLDVTALTRMDEGNAREHGAVAWTLCCASFSRSATSSVNAGQC
jgi:hypothetical protein